MCQQNVHATTPIPGGLRNLQPFASKSHACAELQKPPIPHKINGFKMMPYEPFARPSNKPNKRVGTTFVKAPALTTCRAPFKSLFDVAFPTLLWTSCQMESTSLMILGRPVFSPHDFSPMTLARNLMNIAPSSVMFLLIFRPPPLLIAPHLPSPNTNFTMHCAHQHLGRHRDTTVCPSPLSSIVKMFSPLTYSPYSMHLSD